MGQAKLRGSFEQRQAQGILKRQAEEQITAEKVRLAKIEQAKRFADMSPEQRSRAIKSRSALAALSAVIAASQAQKVDFANAVERFKAG
jgi:hypothetical protein